MWLQQVRSPCSLLSETSGALPARHSMRSAAPRHAHPLQRPLPPGKQAPGPGAQGGLRSTRAGARSRGRTDARRARRCSPPGTCETTKTRREQRSLGAVPSVAPRRRRPSPRPAPAQPHPPWPRRRARARGQARPALPRRGARGACRASCRRTRPDRRDSQPVGTHTGHPGRSRARGDALAASAASAAARDGCEGRCKATLRPGRVRIGTCTPSAATRGSPPGASSAAAAPRALPAPPVRSPAGSSRTGSSGASAPALARPSPGAAVDDNGSTGAGGSTRCSAMGVIRMTPVGCLRAHALARSEPAVHLRSTRPSRGCQPLQAAGELG